MLCIKCEQPLNKKIYKSNKYCSLRCQKLYLKSQWRKRTREKQNAYQRHYRRAKNGGSRHVTYPAKLREDQCLNCGSWIDLQAAHVKPLWAGGTHKYVITLCRKCHSKFDNLLRVFWQDGLEKQKTLAEMSIEIV